MKFLITIIGFLIIFIGSAFSEGEPPLNDSESKKPKKKYFYEWTDEKGIIHITDNFGKVPEPYQSGVRKIESRQTDTSGHERQIPERPQSPMSTQSDRSEAAAKAEWQGRSTEWKNRLAIAQRRYNDLETERNELFRAWGSPALAPVENRLRAEQIDEQMKQVRAEIEEARNMIEHVIPEEARKAGVPPGWLRE